MFSSANVHIFYGTHSFHSDKMSDSRRRPSEKENGVCSPIVSWWTKKLAYIVACIADCSNLLSVIFLHVSFFRQLQTFSLDHAPRSD